MRVPIWNRSVVALTFFCMLAADIGLGTEALFLLLVQMFYQEYQAIHVRESWYLSYMNLGTYVL